jgi:hypothetical protein
MDKLQVEELEPRQLLNGVRSSPQPPPTQPSPAGACPAPAPVRAPTLDADSGNAAPVAPGSRCDGGPTTGPLQTTSPPAAGGGHLDAAQARAADTQWPAAGRSEAGVLAPNAPAQPASAAAADTASARSTASAVQSASSGSVDEGSARSPASAIRLASSDTASSSRETITVSFVSVEVASGPATEPANPPTSPRPENLVALPGLHGDGQALVAAAIPAVWTAFVSAPNLPGAGQGLLPTRSGVWAVREGEAFSWVADVTLPRIPVPSEETPLPPAVARDAERTADEAGPPAPARFGALAVLPPVPLSAVAAGLRQFLEQLEQVGECVAAECDDSRLWPWIVAGAAAATACEIARRQLRQPACVPALTRNRMPGSATDPPFVG